MKRESQRMRMMQSYRKQAKSASEQERHMHLNHAYTGNMKLAQKIRKR